MKITFIGVPYDGTGFSVASKNTILGLDAVDVDIVSRHIKLATQYIAPPKRIDELEAKSTEGTTHVISHILCPLFNYDGRFKNIGYTHFETTNFKASGWQYYINALDELWVSCQQNKEAAIESGVTIPIKVVPIPLNPDEFTRAWEPVESVRSAIGNRYSFYHIGDFSSRKNIANLVKCYYEEFTRYDNVVLVLKTYLESKSADESFRLIKAEIESIKANMRKHGMDVYPPIILLTDYYTDEAIMKLHACCDCFVSLERGAGWGLPMFYAAAFGKWVICNKWGGPSEFMGPENGVTLDYKMIPVYGMASCIYQNLYTANEMWAEVDFLQAKNAMRQAYEKNLKGNPTRILEEFSYQKAGEKIKKILNG